MRIPLLFVFLFMSARVVVAVDDGNEVFKDPNDISARVIKSSFNLKTLRPNPTNKKQTLINFGTAFAVNLSSYGKPDALYLLTATHNIYDKNSPAPHVFIETAEGKFLRCAVVKADKDTDLCLLQCSENLPATLKIADKEAENGNQIIIMGCPAGVPPGAYKGFVARSNFGVNKGCAAVLFYHGCSGGPVLNTAQEVVGLAVEGIADENTGRMVPAVAVYVNLAALKKFLQGVTPK